MKDPTVITSTRTRKESSLTMKDSWLDDAAGTRRLIVPRNISTTIPWHDERCMNTQKDQLGSAPRRAFCAKSIAIILLDASARSGKYEASTFSRSNET